MSEQTMPASKAVILEQPGEQVGRLTRVIGAVSDFMILAGFTGFGAFVGLFLEDALVHLDLLAAMEGSKHGHYGSEFMYVGAAIGALYVTFKNFVGVSATGQTLSGQLLRVRIASTGGESVSAAKAFFIRIGVPTVIIGALIQQGMLVEAAAVGGIILLVGLLTGRCLNDLATGTHVEWSNDVDEIPSTIHLSEALRRVVDRFGRFGSWWIVPVVLITCFDVLARKAVWTNSEGIRVGIQIWLVENFGRFFDSTLLQEMEWHSHTILFAFVLGYGYINNTHVRVDLLRERFDFRLKAKLEFFGLTFFLIPYCLIVCYFASGYAVDSYAISEISASQVGLPMRWVIKSLLCLGLFMTVAAGFSVWLQVAVALWGPQGVRFPLMTIEWPEEAGSKIEGKERLDLSKVEDELEKRARESGHLTKES
jgi:TRAP-type mannitol/chloroaromatic compound transport system permease small subunit